jgi:hypothetical protein
VTGGRLNWNIELELDKAERKALDSLARYKFWMFGYHAGHWVMLNRLLPTNQRRKNPFRELVMKAREMRQVRKEAA